MKNIRYAIFFILLNVINGAWADQAPHTVREPIIRGIMDRVISIDDCGNFSTSLEMTGLAKAGLCTIGLGLVCTYWYVVIKGVHWAAEKGSGKCSSFYTGIKKRCTHVTNQLLQKFTRSEE